MGKEILLSVDVDVEEGEVSDSDSIEEITAEVFSAKSPVIRSEVVKSVSVEEAKPQQQKQQQQQQQVWTMQDLVKYQKNYQMSRNYAPGLYNFAWAQAVQNKPLDDYAANLNMNLNNSNGNGNGNNSGGGDKSEKVVVDVSGDESEKEEGELEEGEIDLVTVDVDNVGKVEESKVEKWVEVIRVGLEGITVNDANKSLSGVCSRLEDMLDSLSTLISENSVSNKDDLVMLAFSTIQLVNSVFCSMSQERKELSRHIISRMLTNVKSCMAVMFSPELIEKVENMFLSCKSNDVCSTTKADDTEVVLPNHVNQEVVSLVEESDLDVMPISSSDQNARQSESYAMPISSSDQNARQSESYVMPISSSDQNARQSESLKIQTSTSKSRVLLPLLDLHMDHDVDSLPSPTRENTNVLPLGKRLFIGDAEIRPEWPTPAPRPVLHRYETEALKAVSTYQQKFSRSSFLSSDLPSPTPSEESGGDAGGDCGGEVSSFSNVQSSYSLPSVTVNRRDFSSIPERPNVQLHANVSNVAPVYSTSSSVTRAPNKTRDPRLRLADPRTALEVNKLRVPLSNKRPTIEPLDGLQSSRKQKTIDERVHVDSPSSPKRPKIEFSDFGNARNNMVVSKSSGLENVTTASALPSTSSGSAHIPVTGVNTNSALPSTSSGSVNIPVTGVSSASPSLQSILKDIAVNPTQWMNLVGIEHRSADPAKYVTPTSQSSFLGSMPMTTGASQSLAIGKRSTDEMQLPQTSTMDESGKLRMKPRDPRRALHSKLLQKQEPVSNSSTAAVSKGNSKPKDPRVSSQPTSAPDISRLFTKNLKNIAAAVSTTANASVQMPSSQTPGRLQNGTGPMSEEVVSGLGHQSHNAWGEVEQLFGKFDDQERAAIQKERSKRLEEQKKMFVDRKLCLVLDLDHTLLNSAKFSEIDPVHDEMLKKKEDQDRDKPHRHLFRFPHMSMWTKLRPGIWNFLEKASKLYELHLYTMGNKRYATEMARVLDPKGVLFNGRVISRGDDGDSVDGDPKSKDLEGVLGMESGVVIIDDSIRVWPHNKLNLIVVERYIYFPCSRRQFGLPGPSLLEIDHDERPEEGTLASSLAVIEKIHQLFFLEKSLEEADVRNILASEQRKILGGCRIVFSRVIPVGEASPHLHPLWQTAEQFGAVCTNQIDERVTHVVANSLGTDKVNWALATGRPVVHPGWVEASALLYRRANENDFAVKP